jgi:hypothetical protein
MTLYDLARPDAPHGLEAGLDEECPMGLGTQPSVGHDHVTRWYARMDGLHVGKIMGEEGCHDELQEESRVGMEQPQQPRHREVAPWPRPRRLAEGFLEGRRIGHRASRALNETGAMALPPPFTREGGLRGGPEALQEQGTEAQR